MSKLFAGMINRRELVSALIDEVSTPRECAFDDTVREIVNKRLDHHGGQPIAGHGGIPHQECVLLGWCFRPELREDKPSVGDLVRQPTRFSAYVRPLTATSVASSADA
jgi:hypothetical protein